MLDTIPVRADEQFRVERVVDFLHASGVTGFDTETVHVEQFPAIEFRSTKIEGNKEEFRLTGDLTIRGVAKPITLDVTFEGQTKDPWGGERIGFSAKGKIDRRDFGLTWNQLLEAGGVAVGNEIKINVEVEAVKAA